MPVPYKKSGAVNPDQYDPLSAVELAATFQHGQYTYVDIAAAYIADRYPLIVYAEPLMTDLEPGTILGTWAYSVPGKMRFILDREQEIAPGVLPGDLARVWVRDQYLLPFRRRKDQVERHFSVPLHARRGKHGYCSYVDVKAAYRTVLQLGYDLEYHLGEYIGAALCDVPPEIAQNKFAYSMAVTMSGNGQSDIDIVGKSGVFTQSHFNIYSNPCLFNLAQDTLNGIGAEMLAVLGDKCVYANTDGYIVKQEVMKYAVDIIRSWGFQCSIKHEGETVVWGVGSFKCGEYVTDRKNIHAPDFTNKLMDRDQRRWLKTRWVKWHTHLPVLA